MVNEVATDTIPVIHVAVASLNRLRVRLVPLLLYVDASFKFSDLLLCILNFTPCGPRIGHGLVVVVADRRCTQFLAFRQLLKRPLNGSAATFQSAECDVMNTKESATLATRSSETKRYARR